jgi:DNA replication protein DnaC
MLSIKQREERKLWWQSAKGFVKNWRLLWNIKTVAVGSWSLAVHAAACEKHGDYQRISLEKPIVALKMLSTPNARSV